MVILHLEPIIRNLCLDLGIDHYSVEYVVRRHKSEGIRFLTEALPRLSKAVILSIEEGRFNRQTLTDFRFRGATLLFLQSLLNSIFCRSTGVILPNPDPEAIQRVRQLCEYFYKLAISLDKEKENEAISAFIKNEEELEALSKDRDAIAYANLLRKDFETHYREISQKHVHEILAAHPPRKTSGTFVGSDSMYFLHRISTVNRRFLDTFNAYKGYYKPYKGISRRSIKLRPAVESNFSELLLVPKDSRGPRTICRESLKRLETQMAYFDFMCKSLTSISDGAINFLDQEVNRNLARLGSESRFWATLDLKDASDRVSYKLVSEIFRNSPGVSFFLRNARAEFVKIKGSTRRLYKVAGMGSGLTFPTMSLIASLAICHEVRKVFPQFSYNAVRKSVFVYGDDIIVPNNWYNCALRGLSKIGLKVNIAKSFTKSHFRESCGADFYDGSDVSITRLKLSNSAVEISETGKDILCSNFEQGVNQVYEHSVECYKRGLNHLSRFYVNALKPTGLLVPGCLSDATYLVDYHAGTEHLAYDRYYPVNTVVAKAIRNVDERKFVSDNGMLERDPYDYLGSFLKRTSGHVGSFARTVYGVDTVEQPTSFSELTIPRTAKIITKMVPGYLLKKESPDDAYIKLLSRRYHASRALMYSSFFLAFLSTQEFVVSED